MSNAQPRMQIASTVALYLVHRSVEASAAAAATGMDEELAMLRPFSLARSSASSLSFPWPALCRRPRSVGATGSLRAEKHDVNIRPKHPPRANSQRSGHWL